MTDKKKGTVGEKKTNTSSGEKKDKAVTGKGLGAEAVGAKGADADVAKKLAASEKFAKRLEGELAEKVDTIKKLQGDYDELLEGKMALADELNTKDGEISTLNTKLAELSAESSGDEILDTITKLRTQLSKVVLTRANPKSKKDKSMVEKPGARHISRCLDFLNGVTQEYTKFLNKQE